MSLATVLGANEKKDGYLEGNGYLVSWCVGHLLELAQPEAYGEQYAKWRYADLPILPETWKYEVPKDKKKQLGLLCRLMNNSRVDTVVCATDAGREGELIFRLVSQYAKCKKPMERLWISSMEDAAIRDGFEHLRPGSSYDNLFHAAVCRAGADWLVGINATRLFSVLYGATLNVGRVMSPTLALLVQREAQIQNFKSKTFYIPEITCGGFTASGERQEEQEKAEAVRISCDGQTATVLSLEKQIKTVQPPRLYDLTSIQVECNKKFAYSADETLKLIQSLYEKKVTTYPRVDTTFLSDDIYPKCSNILAGLTPYTVFTAPLAGQKLIKSKKVFDNSKVTDHHAIIPTGQPPVNLTEMEKRVFDLVARRFIAVFYPDCKFATTTVIGEADSIEFKATGKQILDPGWRVIFAKPQTNLPEGMTDPDAEARENDEEHSLPAFVKGESGPHLPKLDEKWTQPPRPYTEATLLRAMETAGKLVDNDELRDALKENGIGRPSTRAAIIETLFKRHYIRKERKNLIATPTGIELVGLIREELLKSAELTGIWEKKLREIEKKSYDATTFLNELKQMVSEIVHSVLSDNTNRRVTTIEETATKTATTATVKQPKKKAGTSRKNASSATPAPTIPSDNELVGKSCPLCGKGTIIKGKTAYGCSEWKNGCTYRKPF